MSTAKRALNKKPTAANNRGRRQGGGIAVYADDIRRLRLATPPATLQQIADWLATTYGGEPVSRERVRQVLVKLTSADERAAVEAAQSAPKTCRICGREGKTTRGLCRAHYSRLQAGTDLNRPIATSSHEDGVCSRCGGVTKPGKRTNGMHQVPCYLRWRYENVPGEKERVQTNNRRWLAKKLKKSPGYAKKLKRMQKAAQLRYREKKQAERALALKAAKKALADKRAGTKKALP